MSCILEVMNAFKKAIFTLLSFLVILTSVGVFPGEASAAKSNQCGKTIEGGGYPQTDSGNSVNQFNGSYKINEEIPKVLPSWPNDINKPRVTSFKVSCAGDNEVTKITYKAKVTLSAWQKAGKILTTVPRFLTSGFAATSDEIILVFEQEYDSDANITSFGLVDKIEDTIMGREGAALKEKADDFFDNLGAKVKSTAQDALGYVLAGLAIIITWINHIIIGAAGTIFEVSLTQTVGNLGEIIGSDSPSGESIAKAWTLFKNLANLIFIFLILFVAIKTILRGNGFGDKRLLGGIVVVALLMNFSLLFTKTFIDLSNAASISIYNAITYDEDSGVRKSIGVSLVSHLKLTTFSDASLPKQMAQIGDDFASNSLQFIMVLFATPLFLITGLGLLFTAATLILRLISFIFLMILSPIAFVAAIIPGMKSFWTKWLNALVSNSISLPVLLIGLYLALILAEGIEGSLLGAGATFSGLYGVLGQVWGTEVSTEQVLAESLNVVTGVALLLINYSIVMAALFFAFWGSRKVGLSSASWATATADTKTKMIKYGLKPAQGAGRASGRVAGRVSGVVGRNSAGALGSLVANNRLTQNLASKDGVAGALARRVEGGGRAVAGASFGGAAGGFAGGKVRADERANQLLERRKKLGEYRGGEQKVKDTYDNAKATYDASLKSRKEKEKNLDNAKKEELEMIKDIIKDGGDEIPTHMVAEFKDMDREVNRLENQKKKKGFLSADDEQALNDGIGARRTAKITLLSEARTTGALSPDQDKNIKSAQAAIVELGNIIPESKEAENKAKATWIDTQKEFAKIKKQVDQRVKNFDKNVSDKTLSVTSQIIKSKVGKVAIAGAGITAVALTGGVAAPLIAGTAVVAGSAARRKMPGTRNRGASEYTARVSAGKNDTTGGENKGGKEKGGSRPGGSKPSGSARKPGSSSST